MLLTREPLKSEMGHWVSIWYVFLHDVIADSVHFLWICLLINLRKLTLVIYFVRFARNDTNWTSNYFRAAIEREHEEIYNKVKAPIQRTMGKNCFTVCQIYQTPGTILFFPNEMNILEPTEMISKATGGVGVFFFSKLSYKEYSINEIGIIFKRGDTEKVLSFYNWRSRFFWNCTCNIGEGLYVIIKFDPDWFI